MDVVRASRSSGSMDSSVGPAKPRTLEERARQMWSDLRFQVPNSPTQYIAAAIREAQREQMERDAEIAEKRGCPVVCFHAECIYLRLAAAEIRGEFESSLADLQPVEESTSVTLRDQK